MDNITKDRNYFQASMGDFGFRRLGAGENTPQGETSVLLFVCKKQVSMLHQWWVIR